MKMMSRGERKWTSLIEETGGETGGETGDEAGGWRGEDEMHECECKGEWTIRGCVFELFARITTLPIGEMV